MSVQNWPIIQISEDDIRRVVEALIARKNHYWHLHAQDEKRGHFEKAENQAERAVHCEILIEVFVDVLTEPF